ncbi:hypothetical protein AAWM_07358 [Aspergillus awamori]|uniref:ATPase AAA-type core domain-containing protein n=1 Tax=Aspergillus awamori TaxID=105351 RepID=A0A401KYT2_ASPAW|nr:hypothetical protein AAWM_07358 [Aspergillus awamori]
MEDREREKEKMPGYGVDVQKLNETDFLVACQHGVRRQCSLGSVLVIRIVRLPAGPFTDNDPAFVIGENPTGSDTNGTVRRCNLWERPKTHHPSEISAGELVVDHGDSNALEQQLEAVFKIAKHFNAMLLLDEADAFMGQRTSYHDTHNCLVTIFLREFEYYQGVLLLTWNRGIQFDDAILSRITLTIKYGNLTREFPRDLLSKARTMQGSATVEEHDLQRLEPLTLNGHGIKNIAAITHALAEADANQVNDNQAATQGIRQHITPLALSVDTTTRLEHGQSSVALLVKEAGVPITEQCIYGQGGWLL